MARQAAGVEFDPQQRQRVRARQGEAHSPGTIPAAGSGSSAAARSQQTAALLCDGAPRLPHTGGLHQARLPGGDPRAEPLARRHRDTYWAAALGSRGARAPRSAAHWQCAPASTALVRSPCLLSTLLCTARAAAAASPSAYPVTLEARDAKVARQRDRGRGGQGPAMWAQTVVRRGVEVCAVRCWVGWKLERRRVGLAGLAGWAECGGVENS